MEKFMQALCAEKGGNEDIPSSDSDTQDVDEKPHARLLDAISTMDGSKRLKHTLRNVHGKTMSEGGLASQDVQAGQLMSELMGSLQTSASLTKMKRQLKASITEAKPVDTPAPKHLQDKIVRTVGYEKTVKDVSKWDPVVNANRKAPQMKFPLEQPSTKLVNTHMADRPVTSLEQEMKKLLSTVRAENKVAKGKVFTPAEIQHMQAMSLEEAKERRAELLRMRAIMYTRNSKLRWQNKIKSKRYRRAMKKEKEKKSEQELELLGLTDPQALVDKMEEADKKRILERGRLRHAGGGKFAREVKIFSKYDEEKRQQVQDMLKKHRDLKGKQRVQLSSDSEEEEEGVESVSWMKPTLPTLPLAPTLPTTTATTHSAPVSLVTNTLSSQIDVGDSHTLSQIQEKSVQQKTKKNNKKRARNESVQKDKTPVLKKALTQSAKKTSKKPAEKDSTKDTAQLSERDDTDEESERNSDDELDSEPDPEDVNDIEEDVDNNIEEDIDNSNKDNDDKADDDDDDNLDKEAEEENDASKSGQGDKVRELLMTIEEAFDDDDVVADFVEEKGRVVEEETEKDVDTFLPGWGAWAGAGIITPDNIRQRYIKKAKQTPRQDNHIGHVIITKRQNSQIDKHKTDRVPFPYKTKEQMVDALTKPIGRDFNSEPQFKKNIKRKTVVNKIGQIIQPITDSSLPQAGQKRKATDMALHTPKSEPSKKKRKKKGNKH